MPVLRGRQALSGGPAGGGAPGRCAVAFRSGSSLPRHNHAAWPGQRSAQRAGGTVDGSSATDGEGVEEKTACSHRATTEAPRLSVQEDARMGRRTMLLSIAPVPLLAFVDVGKAVKDELMLWRQVGRACASACVCASACMCVPGDGGVGACRPGCGVVATVADHAAPAVRPAKQRHAMQSIAKAPVIARA